MYPILMSVTIYIYIYIYIGIILTNLGLPPSDKKNYREKIKDKALTASAWIWQSNRATTI